MITIVLAPELQQTITEQAQQKGTTPERLTLDVLHREFLPLTPPPVDEGTLVDFLSDFIGCLDSGKIVPGDARMSKNIGEKFAEGMVEKRKAGHLCRTPLMLTDAGALVGLLDRRNPNHAACAEAAKKLPPGPILTPYPCFTEAMYMLGKVGYSSPLSRQKNAFLSQC